MPCQPFSSGGLSKGEGDDRHLWPYFFGLVKERKPRTIFGEQVARAVGFNWFDRVCSDLEAEAYSVGAVVLGAHSKALPHPRQRLFWFADSDSELNFGEELPQGGREGSIPTIWQSEEILQEGQGRVDELVARHITQRVSSYSKALSLLDGIPNCMVGLRGAGNSIVPQVAAEFIQAFLEAQAELTP